jgi:hypothetical protein
MVSVDHRFIPADLKITLRKFNPLARLCHNYGVPFPKYPVHGKSADLDGQDISRLDRHRLRQGEKTL